MNYFCIFFTFKIFSETTVTQYFFKWIILQGVDVIVIIYYDFVRPVKSTRNLVKIFSTPEN